MKTIGLTFEKEAEKKKTIKDEKKSAGKKSDEKADKE